MQIDALDIIGEMAWFLMLITPLITVPIVWRLSTAPRLYRVLIGLAIAFFFSFVLYWVSLSILFRNGMGPA